MKKQVLAVIGIGSLVAGGLLASISGAGAVTEAVTASGTNNAKITIAISDATAAFGTTLTPDGVASDSSDTVDAYTDATNGSYYKWSAAGSGVGITVKSNKVWDGTIEASENAGTSGDITVAGGSLKWAESDCASYAACDSTTAFETSPASWKSSVAKGVNSYNQWYSLRVRWTDDPGTFSSTVTYTVTQQ